MHPIALKLGPLPIHWYGVMVALAFLVGLWTAGRRARLVGIAEEKIVDAGPWLIVGTILGARTLYVISYWDEQFAREPFWEIFMVQKGGLVFYGGLIGATLAFILYAKLKQLPFWKTADILAPSIAMGYVFGRIGCLLNGCCYGRVCTLPWAIQFPRGSDPFKTQVARHLLDPGATSSLPVHPTEIYESLLSLCLYLALAWLFRRKKFDGQVIAAYLIGYSILRSFVETFRGDYPQYYFGGRVTPAQLVSAVVLVAGLVLWRVLPRPAGPAEAGGKRVA